MTVRITIEKMAAVLKVVYRVYKIPIEITVSFFVEIREKPNLTWTQKILNGQSNPRKRGNAYHSI